jgi:N6-adenosine-specific RNA methylase IME4
MHQGHRMSPKLPAHSYRTIVVDPPWPGPTEHRSQKGGAVTLIPYKTMTGIQLAAITLPAPQQTHEWPRPKRHSEKPAEAYAMIAERSPGPRIDLFARQSRPGFEAWGNESARPILPTA